MGKENLKPFKEGKDERRFGGRRKGSRNRSTVAQQVLGTIIDVGGIKNKAVRDGIEKLGFTGKVEIETLITAAQAITALKGNTLAYNALMDSAHGKPKATIEHEMPRRIGTIRIIRGNAT